MNWVIPVSADALAPGGTRPSTDLAMATKLDTFSQKCFDYRNILNTFSMINYVIKNGRRDLVKSRGTSSVNEKIWPNIEVVGLSVWRRHVEMWHALPVMSQKRLSYFKVTGHWAISSANPEIVSLRSLVTKIKYWNASCFTRSKVTLSKHVLKWTLLLMFSVPYRW